MDGNLIEIGLFIGIKIGQCGRTITVWGITKFSTPLDVSKIYVPG